MILYHPSETEEDRQAQAPEAAQSPAAQEQVIVGQERGEARTMTETPTTRTMADYLTAHEQLFDTYATWSAGFGADDLAVQSLCPDWDVRGVIAHALGVEVVLDGWTPSTETPPPFAKMGEFAAELADRILAVVDERPLLLSGNASIEDEESGTDGEYASGGTETHDSSGQAHMMDDYFKAITENPDLETVLVDASRWGMCITRKMR